MRFCPYCGEKIPANTNFCGGCGNKIPSTTQSKSSGCFICGKQELMPFQCHYCKKTFCSRHRLPENHDCKVMDQMRGTPGMWKPYATRSNSGTIVFDIRGDPSTLYTQRARPRDGFIPPPGMDVVTLGSEFRDLLLGMALIALFVFGIFYNRVLLVEGFTWLNLLLAISGALLASFTAFVCHEIAHRQFAKGAGMSARFVLWRQGLYLTVVMIFFALAVGLPAIAAPGFVLIQGFVDNRTNGKISAAGPSVNIFFGSLFLLLSVPFGSSIIAITFRIIAVLNGILAIFNLLPFWNLDGKKILQWNGSIWGGLIAMAIFITISTYYLGF